MPSLDEVIEVERNPTVEIGSDSSIEQGGITAGTGRVDGEGAVSDADELRVDALAFIEELALPEGVQVRRDDGFSNPEGIN